MNESEIIRQCQAGDWSNFDHLYDAYLRKIFGFIYNRVRHKQTAEDLTSTTFLKATEHIGSFKPDQGGFGPWIFRIARNTIIDHYRKTKSTVELDAAADVAFNSDFVDDFNTNMIAGQIKQHLSILTPQQREVMLLRIWDDLSHKEIAEVLGTTESNSKVIFSRAIAKLKEVVPAASAIMALINLQL